MTYVRVTRDQRGYETTFLLHTPRPGERPRLLYWYRTAPGVRVGRTPLDEDAIRTIEEQYPEIEFDWPQLLEETENVIVEPERRPERRRKPAPTRDEPVEASSAPAPAESTPEIEPSTPSAAEPSVSPAAAGPPPTTPRNPLLDQLVGREIASRLRTRYAEVAVRIQDSAAEESSRQKWRSRADALDPDRWDTPEAVLHGIQNAERQLDELKRDILVAQ